MTARQVGFHPGHRPAARKGRGSRPRAPAGLCRPAAALQQRLPGRRERAGLARSGAGRQIPRGLGDDPARQPVPGRARARLLSSVRDALQSRPSSTARSAFTPWSAFSAIWRPSRAGPPPRRRAPSGKRVLVIGGGPSGLSAAYHLARLGHARRNPRSRPAARRHAAFRHPRLSPAARRSDERDPPHRSHGRRRSPSITRSKTCSPSRRRAASTPSSSRSARRSASASTSRRATPARVIDAITLLHQVETGEAAAPRPPRHHLRRRQYGDGRGAHRAPARRRGGAHRLPSRPRPHAARRRSKPTRRCRKASRSSGSARSRTSARANSPSR